LPTYYSIYYQRMQGNMFGGTIENDKLKKVSGERRGRK
jgi:hypothetical protein